MHEGHTHPIEGMVYVPEEQALFTAPSDNTVKKWNAKTGSEVKTLEGHTDCIDCMVYVPEEQALFTASSDNTVKMWDVKDVSSDNTVNKWNAKTGSEVKTLEGHTDCIDCMFYFPDEQALFTASSDNTVKMWNVKTDSEVPNVTSIPLYSYCVSFFSVAACAHLCMLVCVDQYAHV